MLWEVYPQHLEELHQPRRYVLWDRQIRRQRQPRPEISDQPAARKRMLKRVSVGSVACPEVAVGDGVNLFAVEFIEVTDLVDEDHTLVRLFGKRVITNSVMSEVIEDF